jgi:hypothetical protein
MIDLKYINVVKTIVEFENRCKLARIKKGEKTRSQGFVSR